MARGNALRIVRQAFMFYLLAMVAMGAWLARERTTDWDSSLWVAVYPINGDNSQAATDYIDDLDADSFGGLEAFFADQIERFGHTLDKPVRVDLMRELKERPPAPPPLGSAPAAIKWSLTMRYWAWRVERKQKSIRPDIKLFVLYFNPETNARLAHSLGLQKGLLGVVNAYAGRSYQGRNQVVIAHELMHTVGATDKYDIATTLPLLPDGYAEPDASPLYPQRRAEIMGGRIPLSATNAEMPGSLKSVIVGATTAREINWIED